MKTMKNQGFTLAELLIVMAVIVVLAAIAIPTFAKQLETARESSDVENIRAAASEAFSETYTRYVTDDQVQPGDVYYSTIYRVKFTQHEVNFQYMTPVIEIGTSNDPNHDPNGNNADNDDDAVSGAVTIKKTPYNMAAAATNETNKLPGEAYLQFQFTVTPKGYFYLTDILGTAYTDDFPESAFNLRNAKSTDYFLSPASQYSLKP